MFPTFSDLLHQRIEYLNRIIALKTSALSGELPEGRLRCSFRKGKPNYYRVTKTGDTTGKYIREDQHDLAASLAQKDYDKRVLNEAVKELRFLELVLEKQENGVDSIYRKLGSMRKELVKPVSLTDEQIIEKWNNMTYKKKGFADNMPVYLTAKGERVRSKSEVMIADALYKKGILYHYEHPLQLTGYGLVHPDFMIFILRLRKVVYWEHCGMLDDPQYSRTMMGKLKAYELNGYFPGDNLILTGETANCPLESRTIVETILHYLV